MSFLDSADDGTGDSFGLGGGDNSGDGGGGGGPDLTQSSDSSGLGGGGSVQDNSGLSAQDIANSLGITGTDNFNFSTDSSGNLIDSSGNIVGGGGGGFSGMGGFGTNLADLAAAAGGGGGFGLDALGGGTPLAGTGGGSGLPGSEGLPSPSIIGSTADAPAVQSPWALAGGDPQAQKQPGPGDPQSTGQESGSPPSIWDQLLHVLGGVNPISTASAAEVPQSQNTLTPGDIQAAPFKGPWTGTDTGTGQQLGAGQNFNVPANLGFGVVDPFSQRFGGPDIPGGIASARPDVGPKIGPFQGEGGPGQVTPSGGLDYTAAPNAVTPIPGGLDYTQPSTAQFAADFGAGTGPPSISGLSATNVAPSTFRSMLDPSVDPAMANVSPTDNLGPASFASRFSAGNQMLDPGRGFGTPPDRVAASDLADIASRAGQAVPPTDTATHLALQGLDANPPGSLSGGQSGLDPNAFSGMQSQSFPNVAGGAPGDITGMGVVPGTTAATTTPPVPGSPAVTGTGGGLPDLPGAFSGGPGGLPKLPANTGAGLDLNSNFGAGTGTPVLPTDTSQIPIPRAAPGPTQSGVEVLPRLPPDTSQVPIPRPAPGFTEPPVAAPPSAPRSAPPDTQRAGASQAAPQDAPQAGGGPDQQQRGYFERGQRPQGGLHNVIANMFGGGTLGDTVASLMLQLGIPAALIMAARGGGRGGQLGMLGGRAAMSGAGRGGFAPQFSRNLFPGPGFPNWVLPGVAGALIGNRLDQPQQPAQPAQRTPTPRPPPSQQPPEEAPLTGFTTPRGGNMPLPRPQFTPQGTTEASLGGPGGMGAYTGAVFAIESGGDPSNITKGNYGLGQFSIGEYGITAQNWRDPRAQARAMQLETAQNTPLLRQALGRDPTASELYIAHQQGSGGGAALLAAAQSNPNMPAWQAVSRFYRSPNVALSAIGNNLTDNLRGIPVRNITAGQFVNSWKSRFARAYIPYMQRYQPQVASVQ